MSRSPLASNDFLQKGSAATSATESSASSTQDDSTWNTTCAWLLSYYNEVMTSSPRSTIVVTLLTLLFCLSFVTNTISESIRAGWNRVVPSFLKGTPFLQQRSDPDGARYDSLTPGHLKSRERSGSMESNASSSSRVNFWDDLQPPFGQQAVQQAYVASPDIVHFCFLLHGHRGLSKDLSYMQFRMQQVAEEEKKVHSTHDMVIHLCVANEGKTTDGVANGGNRLVQELRHTIEEEMIKRYPKLSSLLEGNSCSRAVATEDEEGGAEVCEGQTLIYDISISILGNSLGGLFGRYAIAKLIEHHCVWEVTSNTWILDGRFRLHLNIFCTTATPHLGISRHTYVKIPRTAEIGVAHALGDTGRDLFRLNDLLHTMSTSPSFLKSLGSFRSRVAYANAYGTDFAVPASTAAFLSEHSAYPHRIAQTRSNKATTKMGEDVSAAEPSGGGLVIATLYTPSRTHRGESRDDGDVESENDASGTPFDELDEMSQCLDQLGWKKVFVDMRQELPNAELPSILRSSLSLSSLSDGPNSVVDGSSECASHVGTSPSAAIPKLQALQMENRLVESREVALAVSSPEDNRIALPLGHNMIVAFSRSPWSTFMNKGGRPVVDTLAKELVHGIFTWERAERALEDDDKDPPRQQSQ